MRGASEPAPIIAMTKAVVTREGETCSHTVDARELAGSLCRSQQNV